MIEPTRILDGLQKAYGLIDQAKTNSEQATLLKAHVKRLSCATDHLKTEFRYQKPLNDLKICLVEIGDFLQKFSSKGTYHPWRILRSGANKEKFDGFHGRLDTCTQDLQLGLLVSQKERRAALEKDVKQLIHTNQSALCSVEGVAREQGLGFERLQMKMEEYNQLLGQLVSDEEKDTHDTCALQAQLATLSGQFEQMMSADSKTKQQFEQQFKENMMTQEKVKVSARDAGMAFGDNAQVGSAATSGMAINRGTVYKGGASTEALSAVQADPRFFDRRSEVSPGPKLTRTQQRQKDSIEACLNSLNIIKRDLKGLLEDVSKVSINTPTLTNMEDTLRELSRTEYVSEDAPSQASAFRS